MKKKITVLMLSFVLLVTMIPQVAFASEEASSGANASGEANSAIGTETNTPKALSFTAQDADMTIGLGKPKWGGTPETTTLEYSPDGRDWSGELVSGQSTVLIPKDSTMYFRLKEGSPFTGQSSSLYWFFTMEGEGTIKAGGNVMSLVDPNLSSTEIPQDYAFTYLFYKCAKMVEAPSLPAEGLTKGCYSYMFAYCDGLKEAPALPATKMATSCYEGMFSGCANLTKAPELLATSLAEKCYYLLFEGCSSLVTPPALPASKLEKECYYKTFCNCTKLENPPALNSTNLATGCYTLMFEGCEMLKYAPELPALNLEESCYTGMFRGCKSIKVAPQLPAKTLKKNCYNNLFHNCTSLINAPELPATELVDNCYFAMFAGCTSLQSISINFSKWRDDVFSTSEWVTGISTKGMFYCPDDLETDLKDKDHVPQGWIVVKPTPPEPPVIPTMTSLKAKAVDSKTCQLNWDELKQFEDVKYEIYRGTTPTGYWPKIGETSNNSYTDSTVTSGTKYYYMLRPVVTVDGKEYYGPYSNKDYGYPRINALTGFRVWASDYETANISWNKCLDKDAEFWIYKGTKPTGDWGPVYAKVTENEATSWSETLTPGSKYYYMVREAVKGNDGKYYFGPYTKVDYAYPRLTAPSNFGAWASDKTTCKCSWTKLPGDGIQYLVYRGNAPTGNWGPAIGSTTDGSYTDKGRTTGHKYYYMVRAKVTVNGKTYFGPYTKVDYGYPR